jgi:hypothetical protein
MTRRLLSIFRFLFRRPEVERELDGELRYHIDRLTEQNIARGMPPAEARRQAAIAVGGLEPIKDDCRDARLGRIVETFWQDVRYQPVSKVETSLPENALTLRFVYGDGHAEEQGAAGAVVVRK